MTRLAGGMVGLTLLYPHRHPDLVLLFQLALDQFRAEGHVISAARISPHGARLRLAQTVIEVTHCADPIPLDHLTGLWRPDRGAGAPPDLLGHRLARASARHRSAMVLTLSSRDLHLTTRKHTDLLDAARGLVTVWCTAEPLAAIILHPQMRLLSSDEVLDDTLSLTAPSPARKPLTLRPAPLVRLPVAALTVTRPPRTRHALRSAGRLFASPPEPATPPLPQVSGPARRVAQALRTPVPCPTNTPRDRLAQCARLAVITLWTVLLPLSGQVAAALGHSG